jgi:hypothetical protein
VTDGLEAAAAWSELDEEEPDDVDADALELTDDGGVTAVTLVSPDGATTVVPVDPLPDEDTPTRLSSRPPVSTMAPATLATAAMRRPVWAGWRRRRPVRVGVDGARAGGGGGGGKGELGVGASMGDSDR